MTNSLRVGTQLVAQSYLTICNPMDCSWPGPPVHGVLQARILEWIAIPFSRGSSWLKDRSQVSYIESRIFIESWHSQTKRLLRILVYLTGCQMYTIYVPFAQHRPSSQNTEKWNLGRAGETLASQRHEDKNARSSIEELFPSPPLWSQISEKMFIKPGFLSYACKNIILVCQNEPQFGHFLGEMSFNSQQISVCKYKFYTYTIKSSQCVSTEDNPLSFFQLRKISQCLLLWHLFLKLNF